MRVSAPHPIHLLMAVFSAGLLVSGCEETSPQDSTESIQTRAQSAAGADPAGGRRQTVGAPDTGAELGFGWDSRYGRIIANRCIDYAPVSAGGQETRLDFHDVSDTSEMMEKMNVSASVSVNAMFASGSAEASFAKSVSVSSKSQTILLKAEVDNGVLFAGPRRAQDPARRAYPSLEDGGSTPSEVVGSEGRSEMAVGLKPWAREILGRDRRLFRRYCGDSYVASMRSGAMLLATFTFKTSNRSTATKAAAAVKAKYGAVSAAASATTENKNAASNTETEMKVMQIGGTGGAIPLSQDDLADKLKSFAGEAAKAPKFYTMEVASYDGLPDWPQNLQLIGGDEDAEIVADYYWFLSSFYEEIEDVLDNPGHYSTKTGLTDSDLEDLQDEVVTLQRNLSNAMAALSHGELPRNIDTLNLSLDVTGKELLVLVPPPRTAGANGKPVSPDEWYRSLAGKLRTAVPYENPNTLRLKLPLPNGVVENPETISDVDLKKAVIDYYLRPQAKRMCALEATDNECLTNSELDDLANFVPLGSS